MKKKKKKLIFNLIAKINLKIKKKKNLQCFTLIVITTILIFFYLVILFYSLFSMAH